MIAFGKCGGILRSQIGQQGMFVVAVIGKQVIALSVIGKIFISLRIYRNAVCIGKRQCSSGDTAVIDSIAKCQVDLAVIIDDKQP